MPDTERHPFEPFLPGGARVLFLGSFPPQPKRWSMEFYYPNWLNDFWRIMGLIYFGEREWFAVGGEKRFDVSRIVGFCRERGFALYDTAVEVRRLKDNASDAFLEVVRETDIRALLAQIPSCHTIVTTGEKATTIAARQLSCALPAVGSFVTAPSSLRLWRMPSTSRAYPLPLAAKATAYRRMLEAEGLI